MTRDHKEDWALHAYVDNELSAEQRAEVEALLARDASALQRVEGWKRQRDMLKGAYDGVLDEAVPPQLAAVLRGRPQARPFRVWLAIAASLLLLLTGGLGGWLLKGGTSPTAMADLGREALAAHAVYSVEISHPVEVRAAEKDHLQAWLSKRLGTPFTLPDLTEQGYALLGGRLLPGEKRPAALLMYENARGNRITVLLTAPDVERETALLVEQQGPLIACSWQDGKLAVAVAGDMPRDPMMALAKAVYEKLEG